MRKRDLLASANVQVKRGCPYLSSVQFSHLVMSDSLRPHGLYHTKLCCPSPTPGACSNSCPSSRWYHPTISSCCPLLPLPLIFLSIRVFSNESVLHIRWQNIGASASASVLPVAEYSGVMLFPFVHGLLSRRSSLYNDIWIKQDMSLILSIIC